MAGLTLRPLAADHDRNSFDCGRESLNLWFRRRAWRNQESGTSRTTVLSSTATGAIIAYVSLSAAQLDRTFLPKTAQRNQPNPIPALLLGQLAIDTRFQGQGHGRSLLLFALTTAVRLSRDMGCYCVFTHPLDDSARDFYRSHGFEDLPFDPMRSMAVRITDLASSSFGQN